MNRKEIAVQGETRTAIERFEQLDVWRRAHALVLDVYRATAGLPDHEKFGIVSQMRRAAVSVPANIAEGFKRYGRGEKRRFYNMSQASLEELRYYCILCRDLGYTADTGNLIRQSEVVGRILTMLMRSVAGTKT